MTDVLKPKQIVKIYVSYMYETCERHSFYVNVTTDEGYDKTVECHRTGSIYNNYEGLSKEEAMDRALMDAGTWADFLCLPVEPFEFEGEVRSPSMTFNFYHNRRELEKRKKAKSEQSPQSEPKGNIMTSIVDPEVVKSTRAARIKQIAETINELYTLTEHDPKSHELVDDLRDHVVNTLAFEGLCDLDEFNNIAMTVKS